MMYKVWLEYARDIVIASLHNTSTHDQTPTDTHPIHSTSSTRSTPHISSASV